MGDTRTQTPREAPGLVGTASRFCREGAQPTGVSPGGNATSVSIQCISFLGLP